MNTIGDNYLKKAINSTLVFLTVVQFREFYL